MCVFRDLWLQMFVKPSSRENCSTFWTICFRSEKTNTQGDMQQMKNHTRATLSCFLSDKVSSLSCCCARVCVFETWWIHTAIHPARQWFHYFTTSLIPSSWSFSVRMDGKHPVKLPHTFTSTQLIVTAHHTNSQREKEDEIKTANFGKEIRVRKKGRMEMAKEKRKKKYCDWVELCSWLIFWVHKERKWCAVEWEGWQHFMLLQKMTSFLQTDSIASHIPRQRHFFSMYCYCQTDVTKSGHSPFVQEKRDINWVLFWYKV